MSKIIKKVVVLGTGGTIAGTAASSADHTGYTAAQIGVAQLMDSVPGLHALLDGAALHTEQVAQLDSKDMDFGTMAQLAQRCGYWLQQPDVAGVVVTHGTDTLEETAWFLHCVLPQAMLLHQSVVLTCAMRPATSSESDGPANLRDAVQLALHPHSRGVLCVCAGDVHCAEHVQKVHTHTLNAFSSGDAPLYANITSGELIFKQNKPITHVDIAQAATKIIAFTETWPRVEIVHNHSQATGDMVHALLAKPPQGVLPVQGIVVAATGNGTLSAALKTARVAPKAQGVRVLRSTRCVFGSVSATAHDLLPHTPLPPVKARISMVLELLQAGR
jgi:L-asparaginase